MNETLPAEQYGFIIGAMNVCFSVFRNREIK